MKGTQQPVKPKMETIIYKSRRHHNYFPQANNALLITKIKHLWRHKLLSISDNFLVGLLLCVVAFEDFSETAISLEFSC